MRALKVAMAVMGVLIVGGTVTLVALLVQRTSGSGAAAAFITLDEPMGTQVAGVTLSQDRLAVQLRGGGPDRVVLVDARTGRVLSRIGLMQ